MNKSLILVTGATDGIGKQTALELIRAGADVIVHGRSKEKVTATAEEIARQAGGRAPDTVVGDLASMDAVRELARALRSRPRLPAVLLHNAGVFETERHVTVDGFERTFAINHLAPFLLTHLLLDKLVAPARIVLVASGVHRSGRISLDDLHLARGYEGYRAYAQSKLANVLFANELARRLGNPAIGVFSLHPGVIATKLLRTGFGGGGASLSTGARTSVFAALDPSLEGRTALYLDDAKVARCSDAGRDEKAMRALYDASCALVGIDGLPG